MALSCAEDHFWKQDSSDTASAPKDCAAQRGHGGILAGGLVVEHALDDEDVGTQQNGKRKGARDDDCQVLRGWRPPIISVVGDGPWSEKAQCNGVRGNRSERDTSDDPYRAPPISEHQCAHQFDAGLT